MKKIFNYSVLLVIAFIFSIVNIRCESAIQAILGIISGTVKSGGQGNLAINDATVGQDTGPGDNIAIDPVVTDANGHYEIRNVPAGTYKLIFKKGEFSDTALITVSENQNVNQDANLEPNAGVKLAFLYGERDNIQSVVRGLGYMADSLEVEDFNNLSVLQNYKMIFINSGDDSRFNLNTPTIQSNISDFISEGGKLYVSDWGVESIGPTFDVSGFFNGNGQTIPTASIVDGSLKSFLHDSTVINLNYIQSNWLSLDVSVDSCNCFNSYVKGTYTTIGGSVSNRTISFYKNVGIEGGKFIFTTFRNESGANTQVIRIMQFYIYDL